MFHYGDSAVFVAAARRSRAVVAAFLGHRRPAFWTSDSFGAQAGWATKGHQACLAHLIRDVQHAIEAGDAVLGPGLNGLLKRAWGAHIYADIRSVIETVRRRSVRAIDAIRLALNGEPLGPSEPAFA